MKAREPKIIAAGHKAALPVTAGVRFRLNERRRSPRKLNHDCRNSGAALASLIAAAG
ncbi:hypothetical protein [Paludibacter propionicigenes]|uniref:hypothetical protein n=1 Tax=Paludibacter propionicigenes TaxID=185300 RepID=UPI001494B264|nr:hypothetical protein [Paludibacter propionicigenes]